MLSEFTFSEKTATPDGFEALQEVLDADFRTHYVPTVLDRIQIHADGSVEFEGQVMPCEQTFLEAMARLIEMPLQYACKLDFDLFRDNVHRRKDRHAVAVTVCCNRGVAVNLAPAEYRPARTADVIRNVAKTTAWQLKSAQVTDRGVEISLIEPGRTAAIDPGDEIELGVRISNSETGFAGLKASLYSLRLVCTNGAVMADQLGTARWNYDPRVAYLTSIDKFQKDLLKLGAHHEQQVRLYDERLRRHLLDTEMNNLWRRIRASVNAPMVDSILGLRAEERQSLQHAIRERRPGATSEPTEHTLWDVHNRITAAAQRFEFSLRSRLERIGGSMLLHGSLN